LLPIIPPIVARSLVETSGPNISPSGLRWVPSRSSTTPGSTPTVIRSRSTTPIRFRYFEKSSTIAGPTVCPERLVAAPRGKTGAPSSAAMRTAAITSSTVRGTTTPSGSI
jgi:hypothetical protein